MVEEIINSLTDKQREELLLKIGSDTLKHFMIAEFNNYPRNDFLRILDRFISEIKESE